MDDQDLQAAQKKLEEKRALLKQTDLRPTSSVDIIQTAPCLKCGGEVKVLQLCGRRIMSCKTCDEEELRVEEAAKRERAERIKAENAGDLAH